MNDIIHTPDTPERRERKRRPVIAGLLALLAVGGIGAAATSAAWTDNVLFGMKAEAATFNLKGSIDDGETWLDPVGEDGPLRIPVPDEEFADLLPGQTRHVTLHVQNDSSVTAQLAAAQSDYVDSTFTVPPVVTLSQLPDTLAPGGTTELTVTITAPDPWLDSNRGAHGTVVVTIGGQAVATP